MEDNPDSMGSKKRSAGGRKRGPSNSRSETLSESEEGEEQPGKGGFLLGAERTYDKKPLLDSVLPGIVAHRVNFRKGGMRKGALLGQGSANLRRGGRACDRTL